MSRLCSGPDVKALLPDGKRCSGMPKKNLVQETKKNKRRWTNADLLLGQRRRRWPNIK